MTLEDCILDKVYQYPGLYLLQSRSESRLAALNHLFLVGGNGYEWYDGYLVACSELKYPYGKVKYTGPPYHDMESEGVARICTYEGQGVADTRQVWSGLPSQIPKEYLGCLIDWNATDPYGLGERFGKPPKPDNPQYVCENPKWTIRIDLPHRNLSGMVSPYPFNYPGSLIEQATRIHPDWILGGLEVVRWAIEWFQQNRPDKPPLVFSQFHSDSPQWGPYCDQCIVELKRAEEKLNSLKT